MPLCGFQSKGNTFATYPIQLSDGAIAPLRVAARASSRRRSRSVNRYVDADHIRAISTQAILVRSDQRPSRAPNKSADKGERISFRCPAQRAAMVVMDRAVVDTRIGKPNPNRNSYRGDQNSIPVGIKIYVTATNDTTEQNSG
jgi:hypothetical protein